MPNASSPVYSSTWELVEDTVEYEYRNDYIIAGGGVVPSILRYPKRRAVRCKTYEATILDDVEHPETEIPAPSYQAGDTYIYANPENLSPVGNAYDQWKCDNVTYTKELSVPLSRVVRITWRKDSAWEDYNDGDDESSGA